MARRTSRRTWRAALALPAAALLLTVGSATPAQAHASASPTSVAPGATVEVSVTSIVERDALVNRDVRVLVPRQWAALGCTAPVLWRCAVDRRSFRPHALVVFRPTAAATPADVRFTVRVRAPRTGGSYLFRTLQTHGDGWVEPWVYDREPYPAPRVQVGSSTRTVNGEGTREDPRCFGPTRQPKEYAAHDGRAVERGCRR